MTEAWKEIKAVEAAQHDENDIPNVVQLNLPRDHQNDGAAWVYLPSKDTIYIGPPGSYHVDIANSLKTLVDKQRGEKPITGVQYNDGYVDYFDGMDQKTTGRILKALQNYHEENYSRSFNKAEDDAGAWDDQQDMIYPHDEDYEDPDDKGRSGLDTYNPGGYDPNEDDGYGTSWYPSTTDFDTRSWGGGKNDDYKELKPTPGQPKPIHDWDIQDYLDWRDKKYWTQGGYFATPREDYPHFRWSYGDSRIMPGPPHEGLWVWPTHNGYPDHFSQTGHKGLGNCAQGRIYPHQGDRWEILTWPGRPRNAPSQAVRDYIQKEAQEAVKQYVMEKIGVPEDKIFFTNMHYSAAVSMYNSPSYPDDDYSSPAAKYVSKKYHYDWEPLQNWSSIPEGTWNALKDPEGRQWQRSSLPADMPGNIKLYAMDNKQPTHVDIDPKTTSTAGWEIGKKVYDDENDYEDVTDYEGNENPYEWKSDSNLVNPNESIKEFYDRIKSQKAQPQQQQLPIGEAPKQVGPPAGMLKNPDEYHRNPDGTYSRLAEIQNGPNKGTKLFTWNGTKWSWQALTPEEAYEVRTRWFSEDEAKRRDIARKLWPEAFGDTGDELDENGELIPPQQGNQGEWSVNSKGLVNFSAPSGDIITVTPQEHELAYRLHGDNWWKSFTSSIHSESDDDLWVEVA